MRDGVRIYSVTQLNQYLKSKMDSDQILGSVYIRGEISNYKCYPSGHHYFSLKDAEGVLKCVMFRGNSQYLRFRPENGMLVIAFGRVTVYPRDGQYQLYVDMMTVDGIGELQIAFEQLKKKLEAKGIFDPEAKKPIPAYPNTVALITSEAGAAVRDMIRILSARWPLTKVVLLPVRVQGEEAPEELIRALETVDRWGGADVVIIGRGGGSIEDLWAFNNEGVAMAIHRCKTPVISAVGHEPDVTISDYAADLRASTPSNGAELAVPDQSEESARVIQLTARLMRSIQHTVTSEKNRLERSVSSAAMRRPSELLELRRMDLDRLQERIRILAERRITGERERAVGCISALDSLSPLKVLRRGYALARSRTGVPITSVNSTDVGTDIDLRLQDGVLNCKVTGRECSDV